MSELEPALDELPQRWLEAGHLNLSEIEAFAEALALDEAALQRLGDQLAERAIEVVDDTSKEEARAPAYANGALGAGTADSLEIDAQRGSDLVTVADECPRDPRPARTAQAHGHRCGRAQRPPPTLLLRPTDEDDQHFPAHRQPGSSARHAGADMSAG